MKTTGFFISCNRSRESQALNEFHSLFSNSSIESNETINFDSALTESKIKMFNKLPISKLKNILIFQTTREIDVIELFNDLQLRSINTRHINRIMPLQTITHINELEPCLEELIGKITITGTYKIQYEGRLCNKNIEVRVFECVDKILKETVNLNNPDWLIIVQVMKDIIGFSILKNVNFNLNGKYLKMKTNS